MPYAYKLNGQWAEAIGAIQTDAGSFPPGWAEAATADERTAAGFVEIAEGQLAPTNQQRKTGEEIADVGGVPTRRGVFEDLLVADRKADLLAAIRATRWTHEQAGFTGPNGHVRADDATQGKITGAIQLLSLTGGASLDWEVAPGFFATILAADVNAMGVAIGQHVQACFTRSRQLTEAVLAATSHAQLDAIDINTGWPT